MDSTVRFKKKIIKIQYGGQLKVATKEFAVQPVAFGGFFF